MKTIESCEMSSSPSPPRLEDPDLIKMSKDDIEKTVEKNGFKEDKITKEDTINGSLSENEEKQKSEKIETTNGDQSEVKENGIDTEVKENGMKKFRLSCAFMFCLLWITTITLEEKIT